MNPYFENLKAHIKANPPNFGDGESILTMLYECYNEKNPMIMSRYAQTSTSSTSR